MVFEPGSVIQMKYSNVFIIAVLVSVIAAAGFVCIADDSVDATPSNSGEAFVEDINALLKENVGDDVFTATYNAEGIIEINVNPDLVPLIAFYDTAELKEKFNQIFVTYQTFYMDGTYYVDGYVPNVDEGFIAGLCVVGQIMENICAAEPGTVTVYESSELSITKAGYAAYDGGIIVKAVIDQDDIEFANFVGEFFKIDTSNGHIYFEMYLYGIDREDTIREIVHGASQKTADEFFMGNVNAGKVNILCQMLLDYPGITNTVVFAWESNGELYSLALDNFKAGDGSDAFQRLMDGIYNSPSVLPGFNSGWDVPIKTFQDAVTGDYFIDDGITAANYYTGHGHVVTLKTHFDATIHPGYLNSGVAFVQDMNRFFEEVYGSNDVFYGVYSDECLRFYIDYSTVYSMETEVNFNSTIEEMAKAILTSYDLFSVNGTDIVINGVPEPSSAYMLAQIAVDMADTVCKSTPGTVDLFVSDSFSVKKTYWEQYDGQISLTTELDQFTIDAANYVSQFIKVDPETLTVTLRAYVYGLDDSYTAEDLAFIYSNVNATQLFGDEYDDYVNWGSQILMNSFSDLAPYFTLVWDLDEEEYAFNLNEFTPGEGADAFQQLVAGIYNNMNLSPAGYENGWEVPVRSAKVSDGYYEADGRGVMSLPDYPLISVPAHGELLVFDRPYAIDVVQPEHGVIIIVPGISPDKVIVVVIPDEGYEVKHVYDIIDGVVEDITDSRVFNLTGDAIVTADIGVVGGVSVTGVTLDKSSATVLVGNTLSLTATVLPSDATNKNVYWSTSNPSVATVINGIVYANGVGTATITVTTADGGYTAKCVVTVVDYIPVSSMTLNFTSIIVKTGHVVILEPIFTPEGAYDKVIWSSSDESVATVYHGVVRAISAGTATITATTVTDGVTATCVVTVVGEGVVNVKSVSLNTDEATIGVGDKVTLVATVLPANATNKAVIWSSSDESVATVSNGVVTGIAPGITTITVTTVDGGKTATCEVTVVFVPVEGVNLVSDEVTINVGDTATLTYTITPSNATNKAVTWSTSDSSVVTVNNGVITGIKAGTATITVTTVDGGKTDTCKVTVIEKTPSVIPVTGVTLDQTSKTIGLAEEFTLVATVLPSDATNKAVYWSTSDASVATVTNGLVRGVGLGTATITVTTADGAKTATCEVTVVEADIPVTGVSVGPAETEVYVGSTVTLIATITPANATNQNVTWSSADSSIASVDKNGVVTGIAVGSTTVTVTTEDGGYTASCVVNVVKSDVVSVTGVSLDKNTASLKVGESLTLSATVKPSDATNKNITWSTSNSKIVTVSNGVVKAVAEGTATITVTTEDGNYTDTCQVTVTAADQPSGGDNTLLYVGIAAAIIIIILVAALLMRNRS